MSPAVIKSGVVALNRDVSLADGRQLKIKDRTSGRSVVEASKPVHSMCWGGKAGQELVLDSTGSESLLI